MQFCSVYTQFVTDKDMFCCKVESILPQIEQIDNAITAWII